MTSRTLRCHRRAAGCCKSARTDCVRISKLLSTAQCGSMQRVAWRIQLSLLLALPGIAMPPGGNSNTPSSKSQGNLMTLRTVQGSRLVPRNREVSPSTITIFVHQNDRVSVWHAICRAVSAVVVVMMCVPSDRPHILRETKMIAPQNSNVDLLLCKMWQHAVIPYESRVLSRKIVAYCTTEWYNFIPIINNVFFHMTGLLWYSPMT
jgi:hypothetical protein